MEIFNKHTTYIRSCEKYLHGLTGHNWPFSHLYDRFYLDVKHFNELVKERLMINNIEYKFGTNIVMISMNEILISIRDNKINNILNG